jgi:hypothetical protein
MRLLTCSDSCVRGVSSSSVHWDCLDVKGEDQRVPMNDNISSVGS